MKSKPLGKRGRKPKKEVSIELESYKRPKIQNEESGNAYENLKRLFSEEHCLLDEDDSSEMNGSDDRAKR